MKIVNIQRLKEFALTYLPSDSTLRELILLEKDEMSGEEFIIKSEMYLKILRRDLNNHSFIR